MPSFKIADDCHSFRLLNKVCCQIGCKKKMRKKTALLDDVSDYNFLIASAQGAGNKVNEVWLDTVIFMDQTGSLMGEPLANTIQIYSNALTKVFVTTGNFLSQVPAMLTSPPYAKARSYNYW